MGAKSYNSGMAGASRRGYGEDGIYFDHRGDCRDGTHRKTCSGRWRGVVSLGFDAGGKRLRKKVSGQTRTEVKDKLKGCTRSWTSASGPPWRRWRSPIPRRRCRRRTTASPEPSASDLVRRNVSALVDTPHGRQGRPSQALTVEQAALLEAAEDSRLHAYIVLCLLTGVRSEEARALTWDHVDLDARTISVWRSVRAHGDTKTNRSRRTLRIPQIAVEALQEQLKRQAGLRSTAGELWQEHGLVFITTVGTPHESHNLRRDFPGSPRRPG